VPSLRDLVRHLPDPLADRLRHLRRGAEGQAGEVSWADGAPNPWAPDRPEVRAAPAACNLCRWHGDAFLGEAHPEAAACPRCGSMARDRFLFWCFVRRTPPALGMRVLETSPRPGADYRRAMRRWFDYRCSDDERARRGTLHVDLQAIEPADRSVDVLLARHVLEHVPDTERALTEIWRILAPGGRMYLQVPVLQGTTAPPAGPELHRDDTGVFWRFGYDLTPRLRAAGFATTALVTRTWSELAASGATRWPGGAVASEFDVASMLAGVRCADLTVVAEDADAARLGAVPAYMFLTWECIKASLER
jgi:Methyltransferase domain